MERLKMGDTQALEPLYERYRGVVYAVGQRHAGQLNASDAEDLCQDVFLTLMGLAHRFRPGNTLKGWLCGIAVQKARRLRQGRWFRQGLLQRFYRPKQQAWSAGNLAERKVDMERVLERLPASSREIVVLCLIEELDAQDVAMALGINVNAVWTRLHRARERIREILEAEEQ
jgi:RNA polymerase sigma-70 factor (ECF subfamily)